MYTPEQIAQFKAAGYTDEQIQQAMASAPSASPAHPQAVPVPPARPANQPAFLSKMGSAADGNNTGRSLPVGRHVVRIKSVNYKTNLHYGPKVVIEFDCTESSSNEVQIGSTYSWSIDVDSQYDYGRNEFKAFCNRAHEVKTPRFDSTRWETSHTMDVLGEKQLATGLVYSLDRVDKPTKNGVVKKHDNLAIVPEGQSLGLGPAAPTSPATLPPLPAPPEMPALPVGLPPGFFGGAK